jgi:hypothetical protein
MNQSPAEVARASDRAPFEPDDALRIVRKLGIGLLIASLFIDWGTRSYAQWRRRAAALQYRVLPDYADSGSALVEIAVEILNGTSPRQRDSGRPSVTSPQ